jgi:nucleotide-binding universal stress UspA family protein
MKTIVVGYDNTEPSKRALERAADIAEKFGSQIVVTSVSPVMLPAHGTAGVDPTDPPAQHDAELQQAHAYLSERNLAADLQPAVGDPADTIIEVAAQNDATLIVVGTREAGFLTRLVGSSVSQEVSKHAHCDVLIVH